MTKVVVNGAGGRMGSILVRLIHESRELELAAAVEHDGHVKLGVDVGESAGVGKIGIKLETRFPGSADVALDFSQPPGTMSALEWCLAKEVPLVVGTTGLDEKQHARLEKACRRIAVLEAPNMSLGINLLLEVIPAVVRALGDDFDVEIVEAHHRFKKDAPSGTALKLAEAVARARGRRLSEVGIFGREGIVGARPQGEIGVHALRGGDIVGDHTIVFAGRGERIELVHRVHTRETFARGALRAASFLVDKPPGRYTMADVLELEQ